MASQNKVSFAKYIEDHVGEYFKMFGMNEQSDGSDDLEDALRVGSDKKDEKTSGDKEAEKEDDKSDKEAKKEEKKKKPRKKKVTREDVFNPPHITNPNKMRKGEDRKGSSQVTSMGTSSGNSI